MVDLFRKKIEQFGSISNEIWNDIKQECEIVLIKKRETLVSYEEIDRNIYFVASGSLEISINTKSGESKTVWFFLDEMFNIALCLDSVFLQEPTKYKITALEYSTIVKFSHQSVQSWTEKYTCIDKFVKKDMIGNFIATTEIRNYLSSHTPPEFLAYIKNKYPFILNRVPAKNMAHFMGITPEWYSKLKKK